MRKLILLLVLLLSISVLPTSSKANVVWDGAEVVKGQTGKMTFIKDVKVYKKNIHGDFESLVVKKGNYFRVYANEKYSGQTYYWMSSGYRVQATNLVVFKEVPLEIRKSFYKNPVTVFSSRNKANILYTNVDANIFDSPGQLTWPYGGIISERGASSHCICVADSTESWKFEPTDITIVDSRQVPKGILVAKTSTNIYDNPLGSNTKNTARVNKGFYFYNYGLEINGYIRYLDNRFIQPSDFEAATSKGTRYIQKEVEIISQATADLSYPNYPQLSKLEPNYKVELLATYEDKSIVLYNDIYYEIAANALGLYPIEP
ncbi:hypothetical protein [Lysinibacillus sp. 3P01SB]|uniref:hypothetical protein n=1 Tax=Lysinibacillus sp. 3P01SB TaxID=3132284 RepID=UPI0039A75901